jgi:recombinase-like zinc beta ribbon protein
LTGLITCVHCGDVMVGTTRTRKKMVGGAEKTYSDPLYTCSATLRATGRCRQVALPRDGFEKAVMRILDEEIFCTDALARLEQQLRLQVARRSAGAANDGIPALERRELDLTNKIAEGARRLLQTDESLVPEVRAALGELKDDLERVRATIESRRRATSLAAGGESLVRETVD